MGSASHMPSDRLASMLRYYGIRNHNHNTRGEGGGGASWEHTPTVTGGIGPKKCHRSARSLATLPLGGPKLGLIQCMTRPRPACMTRPRPACMIVIGSWYWRARILGVLFWKAGVSRDLISMIHLTDPARTLFHSSSTRLAAFTTTPLSTRRDGLPRHTDFLCCARGIHSCM